MPVQLKEDEIVIAQCMIQGLTTLLTSNQLIIITPNKEESYPVQDILAIDVYDDIERYNEKVKKENRRIRLTPILFGVLCSSIIGSMVALATKEPIVILVFLLVGIWLSLMYPISRYPEVTKES